MSLPIEDHMLTMAANARITLDHGFTCVLAGALGERMEVALATTSTRLLPGPRLRASALEKGMEGVMGVPEGHDPTHDRSLDGLPRYVASMGGLGVDTIKFLMSSDEGFAPGGASVLMYSEEEAQVIGAAARDAGVWLACHAQAAEAVKRAVRAGFRCIYHCTLIDDEGLDLLEAHRDELFVAPAPGLLYARIHEAEAFGIDRAVAERMGAVSGLEAMQRIYPEMKRRGIRVVPGGDYGFPYNPVGRNARDLGLFVDLLGYTPIETLVAATKTGGEMVGFDVGTVEDGPPRRPAARRRRPDRRRHDPRGRLAHPRGHAGRCVPPGARVNGGYAGRRRAAGGGCRRDLRHPRRADRPDLPGLPRHGRTPRRRAPRGAARASGPRRTPEPVRVSASPRCAPGPGSRTC